MPIMLTIQKLIAIKVVLSVNVWRDISVFSFNLSGGTNAAYTFCI